MIDKTREVALKVLYKIEKEKAYSNIALDEILKQNKQILNEKDVGLISEIVYGVTTWKLTIDEVIKKHSKIKLKKISLWILNVLRMGIYQIIFLDKIPKSAAVNESVNLAKRYGHLRSSNFVNAILRKVDKKDYEELFNIENSIQRISKCYSMPEWIINKLLEEKTIDEVEKICMNSNLKPKVAIRVNNLKISKIGLKQKLNEKNIQYEDGILEDFLILNKVKNIENLQFFKQGLFTIQDEVAGLSAILLNPEKGQTVLDACSSPGGKTTYMAELMENEGEIYAFDIHEHRTSLVENVAKRLDINIIQTGVKDASIYDEKYSKKFDKILLDVPCLGIGVLKRKPDIKWSKKKDDIEEIGRLQLSILKNCSKYLKDDGEIIYSTCSIFKEENEDIIKKFLEENGNFEVQKIKIDGFFSEYLEEKFLKVYQNERTDGFFICKLSNTTIQM